jgi:hypothetical protein
MSLVEFIKLSCMFSEILLFIAALFFLIVFFGILFYSSMTLTCHLCQIKS